MYFKEELSQLLEKPCTFYHKSMMKFSTVVE